MPVIDLISEGIKIGSKFAPLDAEPYGAMCAASQAAIAIPSRIPMGKITIPNPPFGQAISLILNKLEALPSEIAKQITNIIMKTIAEYIKQVEAAKKARKEALDTLYKDLREKQDEIKKQIPDTEKQIEDITEEIKTLEKKYNEELSKYMNTVFKYAENAKNSLAEGKEDEAIEWADKISTLDPWLGEILILLSDIINKKLDLKFLEYDLEEMERLAAIKIIKDWNYMNTIATDFEVAIPYYPDIPPMPMLPVLPPIPQEPGIVRTTRKQFAKWMATPLIPPLGVSISAILLNIVESVPQTPSGAAMLESQADGTVLKLGGCV